jgi:Flp pilus assembly protein TadG
MMTSKPTEISLRRRDERGAALVTSLLVAMLLLAAGGALIATAGMSASNAVDATAEAQAYYAADAGIQAALNVMRRNKPSNPAGTDADFHHIACGTADPCTNGGYNLALWLEYNGGVVELNATPYMAYALTVTDPSKAVTASLDDDYQPRYLLVRSVGRGPKGATKVLEMMVDRLKFSYDAPASLVLRESEDGTNHLSINVGSGGPVYSGQDRNSTVLKGAVGAGTTSFNSNIDFTIATNAMSGIPTDEQPGGVIRMGDGTGETPWPSVVSDADSSRSFVDEAEVAAQEAMVEGRGYNGGCPANSLPLNGLIFINEDCTLGPNNTGAGFMVVTGELTLQGSYNFEGLIFVLGDGVLRRNGGGGLTNGQIYGGVLAAGARRSIKCRAPSLSPPRP